MTERERDLLALRSLELDRQLLDLYDLRVVDGDPTEIESRIFAEQLEIDRQLGVDLPLLAW
jgi:hypothetical protein